MPDAPRWLDREALARHICVRPGAVSRLLRDGRLPAPSYHLGPRNPRWDRGQVDAAFDGGLASADPSQAIHALAQEIRAGR
jgi:hypothetical protein